MNVPRKPADLEQAVLVKIVRINAKINGIVVGVLLGFAIFLATNWLILKGGERVGPHLVLLNEFFIGYDITFVGSLVGFAYGFVSGFTLGYFAASLYNWIMDLRGLKR